MISIISSETFKKEIFDYAKNDTWKYENDTPIIVNFFATWCGPCRNFAPVLEEVSQEYSGKVKVYKIDIDATPDIPDLFGIKSVPTTVFISKNEDPALAMGSMPKESLLKAMKDLFGVQ